MNPTLEDYLRTAILTLVLLGVGIALQRVKAAKPVFRVINLLIIWVMLPAIVFSSIAYQSPTWILGAALPLAFVGLGVCFILSMGIARTMHLDKKASAAMILNASFMNVTYLGLPIVYALFGPAGLGPASLYAMAIGVMHLTFGVALATSAAGKKVSPRSIVLGVLTFPAAFALIVALLFVGFRALPPTDMKTVLDYLAKPSFFLMLLFVGYKMPPINPRKYLSSLATVGIIRSLICPIVTYFCIIVLPGVEIGGPIAKPALIMAAMPPAVFNMVIANKFKLDLKLCGALVFYLTLVSLFLVLPLIVYLFGF